jgi:hypothetical protein
MDARLAANAEKSLDLEKIRRAARTLLALVVEGPRLAL